MASAPNHGVDVLAATATSVYECPTGKLAYVIGMWATNINETTQQLVTITREYSALGVTRTISNKAKIPPNDCFFPIADAQKLVLKAGDIIYGLGNNANQIEMGVEVLEVDV